MMLVLDSDPVPAASAQYERRSRSGVDLSEMSANGPQLRYKSAGDLVRDLEAFFPSERRPDVGAFRRLERHRMLINRMFRETHHEVVWKTGA